MRPVNSSAGSSSRFRGSSSSTSGNATSHGKRFSINNNHNPEDFFSDDDMDLEMSSRHSQYSRHSSQDFDTPTEPQTMASGKYPARKRKKNRLIFNDEEDTEPFLRSKSGKGINNNGNSYAATNVVEKGIDKKMAQKLGMSLRTLLKLPKAHKWVCYEWFYANIDQPLFLGENDFELYLRESFPSLKTRLLRKVEWNKIRRLMGKPRRCSASFFAEERAMLNSKRNKIRLLQQQKAVDINQYKDLPPNIPLSLVIGAKVTALLRSPSDGLFTGVIAAIDAVNGLYRIAFDREGLGSHPVPDYEVLSINPPEFMPLVSFQSKIRPRLPLNPKFYEELGSQVQHAIGGVHEIPCKSKMEPLHSANTHVMNSTSGQTSSVGVTQDGMLGGFPIKFLLALVKLSKILDVKKRKIYELKNMNSEAEKRRSLHEIIPLEFQRQYASTILDLERLNIDLNEHLSTVQSFSSEVTSEPMTALTHNPESLKKQLFEEAKDFAERSLLVCNVKNEKTMDTIAQLVSIMLHLRNFSDMEVGSFELRNLQDALQETKKLFHADNAELFQTQVEIHVNHIQSSLSHLGNLGAFADSVTNGHA